MAPNFDPDPLVIVPDPQNLVKWIETKNPKILEVGGMGEAL